MTTGPGEARMLRACNATRLTRGDELMRALHLIRNAVTGQPGQGVSLLLLILSGLYPLPAAAETPDVLVEPARDIQYAEGEGMAQRTLDLYLSPAADTRDLPVVLYVHGGGWAFGDKADVHVKPDWFLAHGIAFASMNYRLRWDYKVYHQAEDVATAVAFLIRHADDYGIDPDRIVLMGNGSGGHLVSLVGTDDRYLRAQELDLGNLSSVIAIGTASYDINRLMVELGSFVERRQHELIFGREPSVWREASPITHVTRGHDTPAFALLYNSTNTAGSLQAKGFARTLSQAGVEALIIPAGDHATQSIDQRIGTEGDTATVALMTFLRAKI